MVRLFVMQRSPVKLRHCPATVKPQLGDKSGRLIRTR